MYHLSRQEKLQPGNFAPPPPHIQVELAQFQYNQLRNERQYLAKHYDAYLEATGARPQWPYYVGGGLFLGLTLYLLSALFL